MDSLLVLVAFAFLFASLRGTSALYIVIVFASAIAVFAAAATFVHETGHTIASWLAGWRVVVIAVWPVALHLPTLSLVISKKVNSVDGGGYVFAAPRSIRNATRLRSIAVSAGGPLASLSVAVWCIAIAAAPRPAPDIVYDMGIIAWAVVNDDPPGIRTANLIGSFGVFNLRSFVWTIVPMTYRSTGQNSDGRNILNALNGQGRIDESWSTWIWSMLHYNVRLREVPREMYDTARREASKHGEGAALHDSWEIARALDATTVDVASVRLRIDAYRATHGEQDWLSTIDAWHAAVHEDDVERAETALVSVKGTFKDDPLFSASSAAIAARRGRVAEMEKELDQMEQRLLKQSPFPNATFRDLRRKIEAIAAGAQLRESRIRA